MTLKGTSDQEKQGVFQQPAKTLGLGQYLPASTIGATLIRLAALGFGFAVNLILARRLGVAEFGVYQYVMAWVAFLAVVTALGLDQVVIRRTATYLDTERYAPLRGLLRWAFAFRAAAAALTATLALAVVLLATNVHGHSLKLTFLLGFTLLPIISLSNLANAQLQGFKHVVVGDAIDAIVGKPLLVLLLLSLPLWISGEPTAGDAISLTIIATLSVMTLRIAAVRHNIPKEVLCHAPNYETRAWLHSAFPLLFVSILFELNTRIPILLLGSVSGKFETGLFAVSSTLAGLGGLFLATTNVVIGPLIATLHSANKQVELQVLATRNARLVLAVGGTALLLLIAFRMQVLSIFGDDYLNGSQCLIVLAAAQVANLAGGSVGTILVMTGHEREVALAIGLSLMVTLIAGGLLVPRWEAIGAALSVMAGTISWNGIMVYQSIGRLGIDPTALGHLFRRV